MRMTKKTALTAAVLMSASFAALADGVQFNIDGSAMKSAEQVNQQNLRAYYSQVEMVVAQQVRNIRVAQEQAAMQKAGHPVKLPAGWCRAVITINPDGSILRSELAGCASPDLGKVELQAIQQASPLPPPGRVLNLTVATDAAITTPGVDGN